MSQKTSSYTVSARVKEKVESVEAFLNRYYKGFNIDSVYGFHNHCKMYGGRPFRYPELKDSDLKWMYENGIGYRIPITNIFLDDKMYDECKSFLAEHHRKGNSLILAVTNNVVARIREDFPLYHLESSTIISPNTLKGVQERLDMFDTVVLAPKWYQTERFTKIPDFSRIRCFIRAGCGFNCPNKICYKNFSEQNMLVHTTGPDCSMSTLERAHLGRVHFNLEYMEMLGITKFKVVHPQMHSEV